MKQDKDPDEKLIYSMMDVESDCYDEGGYNGMYEEEYKKMIVLVRAQDKHKLDALQAKIDSLMLEFCPEEMTKEQVEEWSRHQKKVENEPKQSYRDMYGNVHESWKDYLGTIKLSDWIMDGHCAMRIVEGGNPDNIVDRVAFIEKTPRVRVAPCPYDGYKDHENWMGGPKGTSEYGRDEISRQWCDTLLKELGYNLDE